MIATGKGGECYLLRADGIPKPGEKVESARLYLERIEPDGELTWSRMMAESTERMYVSGMDVNDAGDIVFASRVYRKITAAGQTFAGYGNWDF
ncbi:MAG: hypothetical protein ACPGVU_26260, partial [Limisphaerales bacterium]